jgi:hypothetical protein
LYFGRYIFNSAAYLAYYQFKKDEYTIDIYTLIRQLLRNHIELQSQQSLPDRTHATLYFRGLPGNYKMIIRKLKNITNEKVIFLAKLIEINQLQIAGEYCELYNTQSTTLNWNSELF